MTMDQRCTICGEPIDVAWRVRQRDGAFAHFNCTNKRHVDAQEWRFGPPPQARTLEPWYREASALAVRAIRILKNHGAGDSTVNLEGGSLIVGRGRRLDSQGR